MSALEDPAWTALPADVRTTLLEEHRDIYMTDDWWADTYRDFIAGMQAIGIHVARIHFSGFWSQGDGACFIGHITNWVNFLKAFDPSIPEAVMTWAKEESCRMSWRTEGRYCHSGTMHLDEYDLLLTEPDGYEDLQAMAWRAATKDGTILAERDADMLQFLRSKADELYRRLESEYEFLTSDETVVSYLLESEDLDALVEDLVF